VATDARAAVAGDARALDAHAEPELLQRRWFAAVAAARSVEAECEVLFKVLEISREAWLRGRAQLARLESLRDSLGDELWVADQLSVVHAIPAPTEKSAA
jgi:hypothetical protein